MKTIEELLRNLARPEVQEFGLVTNRLPSVNIGGKFEPVDDEAPGNERLMQMLVTMGGGRHVDTLGEKPVQWSTRLDGVGVIAVAAILRNDVIQARFTILKREPGGSMRPPSEKKLPNARTSVAPAKPSLPPPTPSLAPPSPSIPPAAPRAEKTSPQPPPVKPSSAPKVPAAAAKPPPVPARPVTASVRPPAPSEDEVPWVGVEDNEPTLQTQVGKPPTQPPAKAPSASRVPAAPAAADAVKAPSAPRVPAAAPAETPKSPVPAPVIVTSSGPPLAPSPVEVGKSRVAATLRSIDEKDRPRVEVSASLDSFLAMAVSARASELFVVAGRPIMLRIAGEIVSRTQPIASEQVDRIVKDLVPLRLRETFERDGACTFAHEHPANGRFRVNVSKQRTGMKLNLRVLPRELPKAVSLGVPEMLVERIKNACGLVLVSGPAGHGKSTTLAAIIDHICRETTRHVMTIEDPIEIVHTRRRGLVSQREVGVHGSRARLFETALRSDVDVLAFGSINDAESARQALLAADGGRLVLATLDAATTPKAIERLVDLASDVDEAWARASLASSLRLVIGQRLLSSVDRTRLHAAVEVIAPSAELATLLREGRTREIAELHRRGHTPGSIRVDESLADLVRSQKVPVDVARQFADSPAELEAQIAARIAATPAVSVKRA